MSLESKTYLSGTPSATLRWTTWFGAASTVAGWGTIREHYANAHDAFYTKTVVVDCSCEQPGIYAYVYSNQPYKIYVCPAFWSSPAMGTDSKAGTLVHEMVHFTIVAGTSDYAYGQTACKNLAISSPAQGAVRRLCVLRQASSLTAVSPPPHPRCSISQR